MPDAASLPNNPLSTDPAATGFPVFLLRAGHGDRILE